MIHARGDTARGAWTWLILVPSLWWRFCPTSRSRRKSSRLAFAHLEGAFLKCPRCHDGKEITTVEHELLSWMSAGLRVKKVEETSDRLDSTLVGLSRYPAERWMSEDLAVGARGVMGRSGGVSASLTHVDDKCAPACVWVRDDQGVLARSSAGRGTTAAVV